MSTDCRKVRKELTIKGSNKYTPSYWGGGNTPRRPTGLGMIASCIRENCRHIPGSNSVLALETAPRRTTAQGSTGVLHTRHRARCKCPLRGSLRLWRALYVPRRTGERSDDAELHTRGLPSVGGPFEGKSPHGAVLWLLNVATGWPLDNRLTACVRIQSVGGPFES